MPFTRRCYHTGSRRGQHAAKRKRPGQAVPAGPPRLDRGSEARRMSLHAHAHVSLPRSGTVRYGQSAGNGLRLQSPYCAGS